VKRILGIARTTVVCTVAALLTTGSLRAAPPGKSSPAKPPAKPRTPAKKAPVKPKDTLTGWTISST
jgi:hypothetical protein